MNLTKLLKQDNYLLGIILSILLPIPVFIFFSFLVTLIQNQLHVFELVKNANVFLLGLAANLLLMRYYLVKLKFEKTGKAILLLTVIMILLFFIFLKNSNFASPFLQLFNNS